MTLKSYLWLMRVGTLVALGAWVSAVIYIDPQRAGILGQILFYLSLFLALAGIFILFFSYLRRKFRRDEEIAKHLGVNFRQGVLLALLVIFLLILQSFRVLTWWDGLLAVAGVFLMELYFLSK